MSLNACALERCVYVIKICHTNYRICHGNSDICHGMPALGTDVNMSSGYVIQIITYVIETVIYVIECMRLERCVYVITMCHRDDSIYHSSNTDICHGMPALGTDVYVSSRYVIAILVYVIECRLLGQTHICHEDTS